MRPFTSGRTSAESTAVMRPENSDQMRTDWGWTAATVTGTGGWAALAGGVLAEACQAAKPIPPSRINPARPRNGRFFKALRPPNGVLPARNFSGFISSAI